MLLKKTRKTKNSVAQSACQNTIAIAMAMSNHLERVMTQQNFSERGTNERLIKE